MSGPGFDPEKRKGKRKNKVRASRGSQSSKESRGPHRMLSIGLLCQAPLF